MDNEFVINNAFDENLNQVEVNENAIESNANNAELDVLFDEIKEEQVVQGETLNSDNDAENIENETPANNDLSAAETKPRAVGVYVKVNEEGFVTDVRSDLFIENFDGWKKIDEGDGDKFVHAQACYFDKPLVDDLGNFQVKL